MLNPLEPPRLRVADRAGIQAAPVGLQLVDDLHGADLRRAGDRAAGEHGADDVVRPGAGPEPAFHRGDQVVHLGERLDAQGVAHDDRAISADAAQVVAFEVHDHGQLGAVLGGGEQFRGEPASSSVVLPRGLVPLIGRVTMRSPRV